MSRKQLADLVGIAGLIVFGASFRIAAQAPFRDLMPNAPLLSVEDWPGSKYNGEPGEEQQHSLDADRSRLRFFRVGLIKSERGYYGGTGVSQSSSWYADRAEVAESLQISGSESPYSSWPDVLRGEPLSTYLERYGELTEAYLCADPKPLSGDLICVYVAHAGHWRTTVWFDIEGGDYTSQEEIPELIRVVRSLLV